MGFIDLILPDFASMSAAKGVFKQLNEAPGLQLLRK